MSRYAVARLADIEELDDGREPYRPVRHHLGITAFGVNAWTGKAAGDQILNEHDEGEDDGHEELYLVLEGPARFELDGASVDAPAGTFVFVERGVRRTAFAEAPQTTLVVVGSLPGKAYRADGWELWAPLRPLYEAGRYGEAAERGRALVELYPDYAGLRYNLACCESLAGETDAAVAHLREAIAGGPHFRDYARGDSDFGPIREDPGFQEVIA
jgi:tetratricopeptide (TPR) repeat protein